MAGKKAGCDNEASGRDLEQAAHRHATVVEHDEVAPVRVRPFATSTSDPSFAVLAKMAQNVDEIAGGRLILGLGCGWHLPELRTFGLPADHLISRFEEAIPLVRALLRGERVTHLGSRYQLDDAVLLPPPQCPNGLSPGIPLLVAGASRRMMLGLELASFLAFLAGLGAVLWALAAGGGV